MKKRLGIAFLLFVGAPACGYNPGPYVPPGGSTGGSSGSGAGEVGGVDIGSGGAADAPLRGTGGAAGGWDANGTVDSPILLGGGGQPASGGAGGRPATGGQVGSGGLGLTGGGPGGLGLTGGAVALGGIMIGGGGAGAGGLSGRGGATGTGGANVGGGAGGSRTGGAIVGTGGTTNTVGTGGMTASGGATSTGGSTANTGGTTATSTGPCTETDRTVTSGSGNHCGYTYEHWVGSGSATMVLKVDGFSVTWTNTAQFMSHHGIRPGSGSLVTEYNATFAPSGVSYLSVYGWTTDPLVEYYIVDSWGSYRPPGGSPLGTIASDGGIYDVYKVMRTNQSSIQGIATFPQYWSVRQQKRTSGTITLANHVSGWAEKGMGMGTFYEVSMSVEGYESSGTADVKLTIK